MDTSQYLTMFVDESKENVETLYDQLLELEKSSTDKSIIEQIFRAAHTLKGMAATMNYTHLADLTHKLENVFDAIRYDRIEVHADLMDYLLETVDYMNEMVEDIAGGGDGVRDVSKMVQILQQIESGEFAEGKDTTTVEEQETLGNNDLQLDEFQWTVLKESKEQNFESYEINISLSETCLLKGVRAFMVFEILEKSGEVIHTLPSVDDIEEENFESEFTVVFITKEDIKEIEAKLHKVSEIENVTVNVVDIATSTKTEQNENKATQHQEKNDDHPKADKPNKQSKSNSSTQAVASKTIRVDIERLDKLMNLFEELVTDRGRLEQISSELKHTDLEETVERMSRVSSDLQNIILTMRMVPINTVFNRFPRMIRQLARDLHKQVEIEIIGAETELDRTVIDEIGDPLVHLIRNAIDHGIELPQERLDNGKDATGKITLKAYHSGNHVFVEIMDNGAGIDRETITSIAIKKGVITEEEAETLTDQQAYELILASGFSTNKEISDVSGRGVGLDVVKTTIESLGGNISIDAVPGEGSTFSIQLPLTLSIISVLLVELQKEKYAIPLSSIIEATVIHRDEIYSTHQHEVIDFRGDVVPLADLRTIFDVEKVNSTEEEYVSIVIVRKGNKLTGLIVDSFIGQQEVVLKSLGDYLTNVFAISGATIIGDGEVALIIDTNALIV
ncbi:MAG TPA: chemotaxis protein CheA [Pseudogracilibacillus sp.]|nr:chemotaxis protein CheA [Pseudogracilibacillus sp.]